MNDYRLEIISIYEEIEVSMSCLYNLFSERFPQLRDFWMTMSREEAAHADLFHNIYGLVRQGKLLFSEERFDKMLLRLSATAITAQLRSTERHKLPLKTALELALEIEDMLLDAQHFRILSQDPPELQEIFRQLMDETMMHVERLRTLQGRAE